MRILAWIRYRYFNPRSHKGSDRSMRFYRRKKDISIHAPTRGATPHRGGLEEAMRISIHAPTRGATYTHAPPLTKTSISIHAPTRGATVEVNKEVELMRISIHAPTRGATEYRIQTTIAGVDFNPRSHKGSDATVTVHTLPIQYFNPRSHKGSDSNFTQNSISVLFHFYQSFPHIIFPHTARFRLLIIFCTFFLVRIAQRFPVCFHFAPKQYPAFYNVCSTDLL